VSDLKDGLERFLAEVYPNHQDLAVNRLANISDGWESEMYSFILSYGAVASRTEEKLVLRIYPSDDATEKSLRESAGMRSLFETGYPVPKIVAVDSSGRGYIDRPFVIMEFVDGQVMWFMLAEMPDQASILLIELYCRLFVRLHALDWRLFVGEEINKYEDDPYRFVDNWFTKGKEALKRYPVIDLRAVMSWLEERRDRLACPKPSAVHQDFHPGNVLVIDDGIPSSSTGPVSMYRTTGSI
jgi:aminoglycoside phosphotransferase (APT) family kinase protein